MISSNIKQKEKVKYGDNMGQFSWIYSDTNKQVIDNRMADTYLLVHEAFQKKYGKAIYEVTLIRDGKCRFI